MHKARAFFFGCAGILCLAAAYHFEARCAKAQAGTAYTVGGISASNGGGCYVGLAGRRVFRLRSGGHGGESALPIPGTDPVIAVSSDPGGGALALYALLANGDCYINHPFDGGAWTYEGNISGSAPVPAQSVSIGQLKAKYAK